MFDIKVHLHILSFVIIYLFILDRGPKTKQTNPIRFNVDVSKGDTTDNVLLLLLF